MEPSDSEGGERNPRDTVTSLEVPKVKSAPDPSDGITLNPSESDDVSAHTDEMTDSMVDALTSHDFASFISQQVLEFLNIMDIGHVGERNSMLVGMEETEIKNQLDISASFLCLLSEYAKACGMQTLIDDCKTFIDKHTAMKQWLTIK